VITNETSRAQSTNAFSPGQKISESLTLKQRLAGLSTGVVWLAHDQEMGKEVSLLFLPDALLGDPRALDELRAQVKLNRQLIHPRVLRTHDFIEENGWAAISSDAVEAETLASLLAKKDKGFFEASEIKPWMSMTCQTLDDAHRAGLLHRDLSPENILITKSGDVLIANFGISRIILDALSRLQAGEGNEDHLAYVSPQHLDGEYPARWDDVYSLGILIYHLLTGKPPFYSGELVPQIRKDVPPSISDRRGEFGITGEPVPAGWEKLVAACLDKHTPQRPKSAREVGVKLGAAISMAQATVQAPVEVLPVTRQAPEPLPEIKQPRETLPETKEKQEPLPKPKEADETLVDDIIWARKSKSQPAPAGAKPQAPSSLAHLLEKIPDDAEKRSGVSPGKLIAGFLVVSAVVALAMIAGSHLLQTFRMTPQQPEKTTSATSLPTPGFAVPKPTLFTPAPSSVGLRPGPVPSATQQAASSPRAIAKVDIIKPPDIILPPTGVSTPKIEELRKALEGFEKECQDKAKFQQQAEADALQAGKIVENKVAVLAALKKTAEETSKVAAEKARLAEEAKKAADQIAGQLKDQENARQKADAEVQDLQKILADKQRAAADAAKARKDTEARIQQQQLAMNQAISEAMQKSAAPVPSPSPTAAPSVSPKPGGDLGPLTPITPDKSPVSVNAAENSLELAEKMVLNKISQQKQPKPDQTLAVVTVPVTYVPNPKSQIDKTMINSLGMKFAPVGDVLFCIWPVRIQDFEVFAGETNFKGTSWRQPGFKQGPDHPVVNVTWHDAMAFCKWLTEKEQKTGLLAPNQIYRLPTDMEWSKAVGLPLETGKTPEIRDMDVPDVYPWGTQWPPPTGAGNYTGEETGSDVAIKGYDDGYAWTSPVGSFNANKYGLYDMGGNVWQWCMDWWNGDQRAKVLRGASWYNGGLRLSLLSSCRLQSAPDISTDNYGFRCIIATETRSRK
jgi:serine/threonine protein kinase